MNKQPQNFNEIKINDKLYVDNVLSKDGSLSTTTTNIVNHLSNTSNPHSVTKSQVGLANVANIKCNYNATQAPTVNDDSTQGYTVGSLWFDTTNQHVYSCLDDTASSAIWVDVSLQGTIVGSTGNNDSAIIIADGTGGKTIKSSPILTDSNGSINIPSGQAYKINGTALSYNDVGAASSSHDHSNMIHTDASGEISALTEKSTPSNNDVVMIEDSANSYSKKKVKISSIGGGGGGSDIDIGQILALNA